MPPSTSVEPIIKRLINSCNAISPFNLLYFATKSKAPETNHLPRIFNQFLHLAPLRLPPVLSLSITPKDQINLRTDLTTNDR